MVGTLYPLSHIVWLCVMVTFLIFIVLFFLTLAIETKGSKGHLHNLTSSVFMPYSMLQEQPCKISSDKIGFRFATLLWVIFALQLGMAYKSNLIGFLTFPEKQAVPHTFHELYLRKAWT